MAGKEEKEKDVPPPKIPRPGVSAEVDELIQDMLELTGEALVHDRLDTMGEPVSDEEVTVSE